MEYARLGRSDLRVSRVAFGCAAMGGYDYGTVDDRDSLAAVHRALDVGMNFFDTADVYGLGHAEEVLGRALRGRRAEAIVATKVGVRWDETGRTRRDLSPEWIARALDGSLKRLEVDAIDLYQLHWPDPNVPLTETMGALARLVQSGKVRHIGCCNLSEAQLAEANALHPIVSLQAGYNVVDRANEDSMRSAIERHGLGVVTYNSTAQGLLSGRYTNESVFEGTDLRQRSPYFRADTRHAILETVERARGIANRLGRSPLQVALRWALDAGPVTSVITGIKQPWQVDENAGATGWTLSSDDAAILAR